MAAPGFLEAWAGSTISLFGSGVTSLALPLTAVLLLDATPTQMGLLGAIGSVPFLLVTLFAGAWVDRLRRRPVLIAADLGRALLLGSIPLVAALGQLRIEQLCVVLFLQTVLTIFYEKAFTAFLPSLVTRERLVEGNSKLAASSSLASIAGPGLAGALVQLVTAPLAIVVDACSFVISGLLVWSIRVREAQPAHVVSGDGAARGHQQVWREIGEGVRAVWDQPVLRAIALGQCLFSFATNIIMAVYILYVTRELGIAPVLFGTIVGLGNVGDLAAALLTGRVVRRWGLGPTMVGATLVSGVSAFLAPLAGMVPPAAAVPLLLARELLVGIDLVGYVVNMSSLRQMMTPDRLQGRGSATMRFVSRSSVPLGALLGGLLGTRIGLQPTLVVGAAGMLAGALWIVRSPVGKLQTLGGEHAAAAA